MHGTSLENSKLTPKESYINAHATGTIRISEAGAIRMSL
jgi:hypothetical protein